MTETNGSSITRRTVLASGSAGAGVAALGGAPALAQTGPQKTFVLVHGAWHGGWCWRRVSDLLEKRVTRCSRRRSRAWVSARIS